MEFKGADKWQEAVKQLLAVRRPDQAERVVRQRLAAHPQEAYGHVLLALTLLRQQREPEAASAASTALRLNPAENEAYYMLSLAQAHTGQTEAAETSICQALRLYPANSKYLGIRAWLLNILNRPSEAQAVAKIGLSYDPTHRQCLAQLAQAQHARQHWDLLQVSLQRLVKAHPQLPLAHSLLGKEALRQERFSAAQAHYEDVLRLAPDDAEAHRNLTRALRYQFMPGRLVRRVNLYMTFISEGTKRGNLWAWGHFLVILIPLSLLCIPILLFVIFEALYWRLHPQVRQLRNRPTAARSYLQESLYRYGTIASALLLLLALLPPLIWSILQMGFPESSLGSGLTGGLTVLALAIGQALKAASDLPVPEKSPVSWLLVASMCLAASIASTFSSALWPWGPLGLLLVSGFLFYWRLRSLQQNLPGNASH